MASDRNTHVHTKKSALGTTRGLERTHIHEQRIEAYSSSAAVARRPLPSGLRGVGIVCDNVDAVFVGEEDSVSAGGLGPGSAVRVENELVGFGFQPRRQGHARAGTSAKVVVRDPEHCRHTAVAVLGVESHAHGARA